MIAESVNNLTSDDYKKMYSMMLTSRLFTQKVLELNKQGILKVGLHPSTGQEAIGIGACYGLSKDDWVIPSLRTMEVFWAKGVTVLDQLNAVIGNSGSISDGKESFHHCGYPELGIMAGSSIVGSQVPVAAGIGLSLKNKNANNVVICFFGDGATGRGDFHEGLNLAAVLNLPVIFICENNLYFQTVPASVGLAINDVADKAVGYGMPGVTVDGQDVLSVHEVVKEAVLRARNGAGPTLIECKTLSFLGHYPTMLKLEEIRDIKENQKWRKRDPLQILETHGKDKKYITDADLELINKQVTKEIESAVEISQKTPPTSRESAFKEIYKKPFGEI